MTIHDEQLKILSELIPEPAEVVLLLGAGISHSAPSDMPTWQASALAALNTDVVKGLAKGALHYAREEYEAQNYYELFHLLRQKLTSAAYLQLISSVFSDEGKRPNCFHQAAVRCGASGIITTNFDRFIETAYVQEGKSSPLVTTYSENEKLKHLLSRTDRYFVVKLHGDIQIPAGMVLTTEDCNAVARARYVEDLFHLIASRHQLLIAGYGAADPDFWALWSSTLSDLTLRRPAVILAPSDWQPRTSRDFHGEDIHVLEFDNADGKYTFIIEALNSLKKLRTPSGSKAGIVRPRLEDTKADDYVYLYCQLTEDHGAMLESFISALCVGELLDREPTSEAMPLAQVRGRVRRQLGMSAGRIEADFAAAVSGLSSRGVVTVEGDRVKLASGWRNKLLLCHERLREIENLILRSALVHTAAVEVVEDSDVVCLRDLLEHVLMWLGTDLAEQVLFLRIPTTGDRSRLHEVIGEFCKRRSLDAEWYGNAMERVLSPDSLEEEDWLSQKLHAQFLTSAYLMHPTSEMLLKEYAGGHILYLGSSVALPLLAPHHPLHRPYGALLRHSLRLGVQLRLSREMLDEIKGHLSNAVRQFQQIDGDFLQQKLEAYIEMTRALHGNVFLEGYLQALREGDQQGWGSYLAHFCRVRGGLLVPDRRRIIEYAEEFLSITTDPEKLPPEYSEEIDRLTREIFELRSRKRTFEMGAAWKLSQNEAVQFLRVHHERSNRASDQLLVWFLTTDTRLAKLQETEVERYEFPIGYSPHNWGQYINMLDYERRSSRHFARLLRRTEYGMLTGNMAIGLVRRLSDKLRKARVVAAEGRIQDLVRSFFRNYLLQQAISETTRAEAMGLPPDEKSLKIIEKALDAFVIKARDDWESLNWEVEAERKRSAELEEENEKLLRMGKRKDHHIGVLRGELRKHRP